MTMLRRTIASAAASIPPLFYGLKAVELLALYALKSQAEPDFHVFERLKSSHPALRIVDVGANIGQSALGFAALFKNAVITSFEANADLARYLEFCRVLIGRNRMSYQLVGLSDRASSATLHVPRVGKVLIFGEAALDRESLSHPLVRDRIGDFSVVERRIVLVTLDSLGLRPDIVKIDVQGHEMSVLRGMANTIDRCAPVFLIERSTSDAAVMEYLAPFGYRFYTSDGRGSLIAFDAGSPQVNIFCLPVDVPGRHGMVAALLA